LYRSTEDKVIARETCRTLITRILSRIADVRVTKDCIAHRAEMKKDATYYPRNLSVASMTARLTKGGENKH